MVESHSELPIKTSHSPLGMRVAELSCSMTLMNRVFRQLCLIGIVTPLFLFWVASISDANAASLDSFDQSAGTDGIAHHSNYHVICDRTSQIPIAECNVLVSIYELTNGAEWLNNENWLVINDSTGPCDWFGLTCENGHVTQINLANNRLHGEFPFRTVSLPALSHLILNDNQLTGVIPLAICDLVDKFDELNLDYNQLQATNLRIRRCLEEINPEWSSTQTVPPHEIRATAISTDSIQLSWSPISYSGSGGGYYEISYSTGRDQAFTVHGTTADLSSDSYILRGLTSGTPYIFRVRTYTPSSPYQTSARWSSYAFSAAATESIDSGLLLLVYFPADNDLSPYVNSVMRRMLSGTLVNPNIRVIMLTDLAGEDNTGLFEIFRGEAKSSSLVFETWGTRELDTTDPTVLAWFLKKARDLYPANRTIVSIMGHGVGLSPEFGWIVKENPAEPPIIQTGIPHLPKGMEHTPGDLTDNGGFLSTHDLAFALNEATADGANPFDVVFFDQCFQGNLDVLYELRNTAEVFIGSPNYAWLAAPYHQYLPALVPSHSPQQMARSIIRIYQESLNRFHPNAIFFATRSEIEAVANAVSNLGEALLEATNAGQDALILQASMNGKYVDTTQCGRQNLILGPPDELLGAGTFAENLVRLFPSESGVARASSAVINTLAEIEGNARSGRPHIAIERDERSELIFWDYEETFTILAPLRRNAPAEIAWRASIYTDETPLTAKWSPVPTQTVNISNTFAFVRDKQWDEFIDVWYTTEMEPTVGDWCSYIPPVIVSEIETETISLELNVFGDQIGLSWEATGQDSAVEYMTLVRQENSAWRTLAVTDLAQTDYSFASDLSNEILAFMVVARDQSGLAVAQSGEVLVRPEDSIPSEPKQENLYLPLISNQ